MPPGMQGMGGPFGMPMMPDMGEIAYYPILEAIINYRIVLHTIT